MYINVLKNEKVKVIVIVISVIDFKKSINHPNQYHVNMGNITRSSLIGTSKFAYQNIHLNLGNVSGIILKK